MVVGAWLLALVTLQRLCGSAFLALSFYVLVVPQHGVPIVCSAAASLHNDGGSLSDHGVDSLVIHTYNSQYCFMFLVN